VTLTNTFPIDPNQALIDSDLESLRNTERLVYIIYKAKVNTDVQATIEKQIQKLSRPREYKLIRTFPVLDEATATTLFYYYFNQPLRYDTINVLTNNIETTQGGNVRLVSFVNTDTDFYRSIESTLASNNVH